MHQALIEEPHLGLRRMHVDVDAIGRQVDQEVHFGAALLDRRHAVGLLNGVGDRAVTDDAAVDEDVLRAARGTLVGKRGHEAAHRDLRRGLGDRHQVGPLAVDLVEALLERPGRRRLDEEAASARQREADFGHDQRNLRDESRDLRGLGRVGLQEFPARREVEEKIGDLDQRALGRADLADRSRDAGLDEDLGARQRVPPCASAAGSATPTRWTAGPHRGIPSVRIAARSEAVEILLVA